MSRKGFYFSFDGLMALSVMIASLAILYQSSSVETDPFVVTSITYERASMSGQDAMKLASKEDFYVFNSSYRNQLTSTTALEEEDLDRTIIDGITLLWAARNFTAAEQVSQRYLDSKVPEEFEYRLQVNEGDNSTVIYESEPLPSNPEAVTSISRLVSGHSIDKPSEGYQARARATSITKNETRSYSVSSQGASKFGGKIEIEKKFNVSGEKVWNATLYLTPHYGCNNADFEQISINGDKFTNPEITWLEEKPNCDGGLETGTGALGYIDVTDKVETGQNNMSIRFRNNDYNAHIHPGMRMKVKYRTDEKYQPSLEHKRVYFEDLTVEEHADDKAGIFSIKSYEIPEDAVVENVTLNVEATGIDRQYNNEYYDESGDWWRDGQCEWTRDGGWYSVGRVSDVRIFHNSTLIESGYAPASGEISETYDLTGQTETGTNMVSIYLNWEGDCAWGEDTLRLKSDFDTDNSTYIDVWYEESPEQLEFGEIDITTSQQFNQEGNPVRLEKSFIYPGLESTHVFPTQLTGSRIKTEVWPVGETETKVFESPASRAVPSSIFIDPSHYDTSRENNVELTDFNSGNKFLPQTDFQYTLSVPSQVGYGKLYQTKDAALDDAEERLDDTLGPFVNATNIDTNSVDTGNQPYLWGPASVRLVIWNE